MPQFERLSRDFQKCFHSKHSIHVVLPLIRLSLHSKITAFFIGALYINVTFYHLCLVSKHTRKCSPRDILQIQTFSLKKRHYIFKYLRLAVYLPQRISEKVHKIHCWIINNNYKHQISSLFTFTTVVYEHLHANTWKERYIQSLSLNLY